MTSTKGAAAGDDKRRYFFAYFASSGAWGFIAESGSTHTSNYVAIEHWDVTDTKSSYIVHRACYSKSAALGLTMAVAKSPDQVVMGLKGPDLYVLSQIEQADIIASSENKSEGSAAGDSKSKESKAVSSKIIGGIWKPAVANKLEVTLGDKWQLQDNASLDKLKEQWWKFLGVTKEQVKIKSLLRDPAALSHLLP